MEFKVFNLGDFKLLSGETLKNAKLAYQTYGSLASTKDLSLIHI